MVPICSLVPHVKDFHRAMALGSREQSIPLEVYGEVIEVAIESRQRNALDQSQGRVCSLLCIDRERRAHCHQRRYQGFPGAFHVL